MPRLHRLSVAVVALAAAAAAAAGPASAAVSVTAKPELYPGFEPGVTDYVSRCVPGQPLVLSVHATDGDTVKIGSHPPRSGDFDQSLDRQPGGGVTLRVSSQTSPATYHVRCLPPAFPTWTATRSGIPQAEWYVVTPNGSTRRGWVAVFDNRGVPVWWKHASDYGPWDAKLMPNGTLAWTHYVGTPFGQGEPYGYEEHRFDGIRTAHVQAVGVPTDTHDMQQMPNGDFLVISYVPRSPVDLTQYGGPPDATVYDGEIQEITPAGKLVWSWNSKNHIHLAETGRWWSAIDHDQNRKVPADRFYDLVHLNTVQPDGDGFIVSARHLDAVFRIDRKSKKIVWKLGGTQRPQSLTVLGDPLGDHPLGGQHDARLYGDGTLTVFDNATLLGRPPRALRYRIDTQARTATLLEDITDADVTNSVFGGSARKLPGGDWVVYWGGSTLVTEQTTAGDQVFSISFQDQRWGYRAVPLLPGQVTAKTLRNGMDKMSAARRKRGSR